MAQTSNLPWMVCALLAGMDPLVHAAQTKETQPGPAPLTQPATQPAEPLLPARFEETPEYAVLKAACDLAKARLDAITDDRTRIVAATPEYQAARKASDEAEAVLNKARASGSAEERMAASGAFVKAKGAVDSIRSNAVNQDPDYRATQAGLRKAETALKDARTTFDRQRSAQEKAAATAKAKAAALATAKDPVHRGQIEGRPAVGMTLAQVQDIYGDGDVISNSPRGRQLDYAVREPNYLYHVLVTFQDDKVITWSSRAINYPTLRFTGDIPQLTKGMTLDQLQARLGSNGRAIRESRMPGTAAAILAAPAPDDPARVLDRPRIRPAVGALDPMETYLQTTYCWKVILQTRNGVQHQVLTVRLADFQVYDYRLGATAD